MSHISTYKLSFKRRLKQKTNYNKRLALLLAKKPRAVIRKSNNNIIVEIVEYRKDGDRTIVFSISKELKSFGWKMHTGNVSAAYLTGYTAGLLAKQKGVGAAVLDIGLYTPVHKSRIFASLKGLIDAGMEIPHETSVFPPVERIRGTHLKQNASEMFEAVKAAIEKKIGGKNG